MKKRILGLLIALVALVSTVGVGFASWVITTPTNEEAKAQITVETVEKVGFDLFMGDTKVDSSNGDVKFSAYNFTGPATENQNIKNAWLNLDDNEPENLTATVVFTVVDEDENSTAASDLTGYARFEITVGGVHQIVSQINNGRSEGDELLVLESFTLTGGNATAGNFASSDANTEEWSTVLDDDNNTVTLVINFAWGGHFGNVNPYVFYNGKDDNNNATHKAGDDLVDTSYAADAEASLQALYNAFDGQNAVKTIEIAIAINAASNPNA